MKPKPIIGIVGGIGAGKSTVAAEFGRQGCVVVDADQLAHEILLRPGVCDRLREWWGHAVFAQDGTPDRRKIGEIVFRDAKEKQKLESLVHPLIEAERRAIIKRCSMDPAVKAFILDSPLLFEKNLDRFCDIVVFVDASEQQRVIRLTKNRGWSSEEIKKRQEQQLDLTEKRKRSRFVIVNEGATERLTQKVAEVLKEITQ